MTIEYEAEAFSVIGKRREEMERLKDRDGDAFMRGFIDEYADSIAKWDRIKMSLAVCADKGGEACLDMIVRRNWLK